MPNDPIVTIEEAKYILGDKAEGMSDEDIVDLINNLDAMAKQALKMAVLRRQNLTNKVKQMKSTAFKTSITSSVRASGASLIDPGTAASIGVEKYLKQYIDGYLLCDLESIAYKIPNNEHPGAAGYPLILTICSGMELLGALLRPKLSDKFDENEGIKYFGHYWKYYLSKVDPEYKKYGEVARALVRNGLAHLFMAKPGIGVVKSNPQYHLKNIDGHLIIDSVKLYEDFKKSYLEFAKPVLLDGKNGSILASNRLNNILAQYTIESDETLKKLLQETGAQISKSSTTLPPTIS